MEGVYIGTMLCKTVVLDELRGNYILDTLKLANICLVNE